MFILLFPYKAPASFGVVSIVRYSVYPNPPPYISPLIVPPDIFIFTDVFISLYSLFVNPGLFLYVSDEFTLYP